MDVFEPRVRHRGFFLHSDTTGEPDTGEHENPEGFVVRVRTTPQSHPRHISSTTTTRGISRLRTSDGRSQTDGEAGQSLLEIRLGSATGSRQRAHLPR